MMTRIDVPMSSRERESASCATLSEVGSACSPAEGAGFADFVPSGLLRVFDDVPFEPTANNLLPTFFAICRSCARYLRIARFNRSLSWRNAELLGSTSATFLRHKSHSSCSASPRAAFAARNSAYTLFTMVEVEMNLPSCCGGHSLGPSRMLPGP